MKFKEIKIQPSLWTLDVIVGGSQKKVNKLCKKRYGIGDYMDSEKDECSEVQTHKKSELKGERRIVIIIASLKDKRAVVHELIHAMWMFAKAIGYEMNYNTQEWQAVLYEYLFHEILDKKGYK